MTEHKIFKEKISMKQLTCEMCASTDFVKKDEVFVCQSCGIKYPIEEAKKMMIEGTVEVTGTVNVGNIANLESLMKRGYIDLEDSKWEGADEYFEKALDIDPEYAPAYIGKLCSELNFNNETELSKRPLLTCWSNYQKALRYAKDEYLEKIQNYDKYNRDFFNKSKQRFENLKEQIAQKTGISIGKEQAEFFPETGDVCVSGVMHTIKLTSEGIVRGERCVIEREYSQGYRHSKGFSYPVDGFKNLYDYYGLDYRQGKKGVFEEGSLDSQNNWLYKGYLSIKEIFAAISSGNYHAVLLDLKGKVLSRGRNDHKQCETSEWCDIVAIAAAGNYTIGLKADGSIVATGDYLPSITQWKDIEMIYGTNDYIIGLKPDNQFIIADIKSGSCYEGSEEQVFATIKENKQRYDEQQRIEREHRAELERKERERLEEQIGLRLKNEAERIEEGLRWHKKQERLEISGIILQISIVAMILILHYLYVNSESAAKGFFAFILVFGLPVGIAALVIGIIGIIYDRLLDITYVNWSSTRLIVIIVIVFSIFWAIYNGNSIAGYIGFFLGIGIISAVFALPGLLISINADGL